VEKNEKNGLAKTPEGHMIQIPSQDGVLMAHNPNNTNTRRSYEINHFHMFLVSIIIGLV
jgi:hypothetical protein